MITTIINQNVSINIEGFCGNYTTVDNQFYLIGTVFYHKEMLTIAKLYHLVNLAILSDSIDSLLADLSGAYAFIHITDKEIIAVTDKLRSRPIFYTYINNQFMLSDGVQWLVENIQVGKRSSSIDSLAAQELMQAGYVTGNNTLVNQVNQVPAATFLMFDGTEVNLRPYYYFMPRNHAQDISNNVLFERLDQAMKESIDQLIQYANNRQLVVPLSGGYDSRAIATYLKAANYKNVITFTFGKPGSKEVAISEKVANALGFSWHFIEYDNRLWKRTAKTDRFRRFLLFISNYVSVPNVQVYPAIAQLLANRVISENAVVVPGHTGDFVSGGHIPFELEGLLAIGSEEVILNAILQRHYHHKNTHSAQTKLKAKLREQINLYISKAPTDLPATSIFECWEYSERQAKFIVNSNRYYDFFILDWWMPLWHESIVDFWENAPLKVRLHSKLWQGFVEKKYLSTANDNVCYGNVSDQFTPRMRYFRKIFDYFTDENGLYALVPFYRWLLRKLKYPHAKGTINSYLASMVIKQYKKIIKKNP